MISSQKLQRIAEIVMVLGIVFLFFSRAIIQDPGLSFANYLRRLCWFVLMGVCASIAGLNDVLFVVMSFCYLFFIECPQILYGSASTPDNNNIRSFSGRQRAQSSYAVYN